jgi:hypothetical protein
MKKKTIRDMRTNLRLQPHELAELKISIRDRVQKIETLLASMNGKDKDLIAHYQHMLHVTTLVDEKIKTAETRLRLPK